MNSKLSARLFVLPIRDWRKSVIPFLETWVSVLPGLSSSKADEKDEKGENNPSKSVLKVNVPAELEGIAFIQVVIQKESEQLVMANICQSGTFDPSLLEEQLMLTYHVQL